MNKNIIIGVVSFLLGGLLVLNISALVMGRNNMFNKSRHMMNNRGYNNYTSYNDNRMNNCHDAEYTYRIFQ